MSTSQKILVLVVGVAAGLLGFSLRGTGNADEVRYWKGLWQDARARVRVDSVRVVQQVTRVRVLRDTLNLTDTVAVREFVTRTDTLIERCLACIASASAAVTIADTVILKVGANARRWYDRVGVSAGYGVLLDKNGSVRHGAVLSASVRVWP